MTEIQYIEEAKKGFTVTYGDRSYRIQDDRKGWLHIVVNRKKIGLDRVLLFEYGSEPDYIFNGWYKIYKDYETFKNFANNDIAAISGSL
jgi:hypothetical protein